MTFTVDAMIRGKYTDKISRNKIRKANVYKRLDERVRIPTTDLNTFALVVSSVPLCLRGARAEGSGVAGFISAVAKVSEAFPGD